jgi:23S rRNA pseudouridine1911/1915/1917 synthase
MVWAFMNESTDPKFRGFSYGVRHCVVAASSDGQPTLLDFVETQLSREKESPPLSAIELIELGSVYVNDARSLSASQRLLEYDHVRIHTLPRRYPQPADLLSRIISESEGVVIVDKPAGLPVHGLVDNIKENLISYLEDLRGGTLLITHRLDVETSGLVLLAKSPDVQARLNRAFAEGTVKRTYAAFIEQAMTLGSHVHYMEPSPKAPKVVSIESQDGWQRCDLTVLSCEERIGETSLLAEGRTSWQLDEGVAITRYFRVEISLQTGRPQQIRAQLAALGVPVIGDKNYGSLFHLIDADSGRSAVALRAIEIIETP